MKESILDVLLYLFEHYFTNDAIVSDDDLTAPDGPLMNELIEAGFSNAEVRKAFDWLDTLARQRPSSPAGSTASTAAAAARASETRRYW